MIHHPGDDQAADVARGEDRGQPTGRNAGLAEPEVVEPVAQLRGATQRAGDPCAKGAEGFQPVAFARRVDQPEGRLVGGGAAGAELGHERGDGGVRLVAHLRGDGLDALAGLDPQPRVVAQGERDGRFPDARRRGDVFQRGETERHAEVGSGSPRGCPAFFWPARG